MLIPNVKEMECALNEFAEILDADEVLLFEKATFLGKYNLSFTYLRRISYINILVISHAQRNQHRDVHRFEKISNIIKQFKLSCSKLAANFQSMEVRNSNFSSFIDVFTANTYVMVILSDSTVPAEAILINIRNARKYFEKLEKENQLQNQRQPAFGR